MAENESERTTDALNDGDERLPIAGDVKEQGKPPSLKDIPKFVLGKIFIYGTFIIVPLWVLPYVYRLTTPAISKATVRGFSVLGCVWAIALSIVLIIQALALRKRKKYGLNLLYIWTGLGFIGSLIFIFVGKGRFAGRLVLGGIEAGIAIGWFVYFYNRRQYFNR